MVVYSRSNYLLRFSFHFMTYRYRLIYFPDLHCPSQIENPMLRQHYRIVFSVGVFPFTLLYFIPICLKNKVNTLPIKNKLRNMIFSKFISRKLFSGLQNMQFILKTRQKTAKNSKIFNFLFCHDIPQSNIRNKLIFIYSYSSKFCCFLAFLEILKS